MKKLMNKRTIIIIAMLMATVSLALLWTMSEPVGSMFEYLSRERLNLAEQGEIRQLIETMRKNHRSWVEIQAAIRTKLNEWGINPPPPGDIELFYTVKTVVSTVNSTLTVILLIIYLGIYRKTKSHFTVGLIIFSVTILLYTLTSNPYLQWAFGFRAFGLGPFAMLPDFFTCLALFVLLYLSLK